MVFLELPPANPFYWMQDVCDGLSGSDVLVPMPGVEGLSETEGSVEFNSKSVNVHNMNYNYYNIFSYKSYYS